MKKNLIINKEGIQFKLKRLAYEILEDNYSENELELIGIEKNGKILAEILKKEIKKIIDIKVNINLLTINKKNPLSEEIKVSSKNSSFENKVIIIVDDVVNTGKTSFYAFKPLMEIKAKSIKMAVLVDRRHKKYPVYCDYVGNKLTTTLQEYISVSFKDDIPIGVYLS